MDRVNNIPEKEAMENGIIVREVYSSMFVQGKVNNEIVRRKIQLVDTQKLGRLSKIQYSRKTFPERKNDELRKTNEMSHIAGIVQQ